LLVHILLIAVELHSGQCTRNDRTGVKINHLYATKNQLLLGSNKTKNRETDKYLEHNIL